MSACVYAHQASPQLSVGHRLQVAGKVTQPLVVRAPAGHMPRPQRKAVFPVKQARVCSKSCCYITGVSLYLVFTICSPPPQTPVIVVNKNKRNTFYFSSFQPFKCFKQKTEKELATFTKMFLCLFFLLSSGFYQEGIAKNKTSIS